MQPKLKIKKGDNLLLCGFGVGLSWGNCILDLHDVKFTNISKL